MSREISEELYGTFTPSSLLAKSDGEYSDTDSAALEEDLSLYDDFLVQRGRLPSFQADKLLVRDTSTAAFSEITDDTFADEGLPAAKDMQAQAKKRSEEQQVRGRKEVWGSPGSATFSSALLCYC